MAQMDKAPRDKVRAPRLSCRIRLVGVAAPRPVAPSRPLSAAPQVYADAKTRDLPLLFVDGAFVGTAEDVQYKEESEQLNAVLGI